MLKNGEFPPGVRCGPRSVRWKESDVDAWIASRLVVDPQKAARSEAA
jgi:predicted DNA-binding transcriptional regulator AlpA